MTRRARHDASPPSFGLALRRYFLTGLFVVIPIGMSALVVGWLFNLLDRWTAPLTQRVLGYHIPGLGILITALVIFATGVLTSNVIGRWFFNILDHLLLQIPFFKGIYSTTKQVIQIFSPRDGEHSSFRSVVLVEHPPTGNLSLGFVTQELTIKRNGKHQKVMAVYVPTNHLYLGDTFLLEPEKVHPTNLTVQEGIQCVISAGAALPDHLPKISP